MKKNSTIKVLLGIIAINLTLLTLIQLSIFPSVFATDNTLKTNNFNNYGLVPLNDDGSISIKIENEDVINVNIHSFKGKDFFEAVPVFIMNY